MVEVRRNIWKSSGPTLQAGPVKSWLPWIRISSLSPRLHELLSPDPFCSSRRLHSKHSDKNEDAKCEHTHTLMYFANTHSHPQAVSRAERRWQVLNCGQSCSAWKDTSNQLGQVSALSLREMYEGELFLPIQSRLLLRQHRNIQNQEDCFLLAFIRKVRQ